MSDAIQPPLTRVLTGVAGVDQILQGGLFGGGAYIVMGLPGTGKTTLGNQIAFSHVARGGRALYVTLLSETHARMLQHLRSFSFFDQKVIGHGLAYLSAFQMLEAEGLKGVLKMLKQEVRESRITLLVIDGLVTAEAVAASDTEVKKFVHEVQSLMSLTNCTTLLLTNLSGRTSYPTHTMVDGIIELRDEQIGFRAARSLTVLKFRGGEQLRGRHVFDIAGDGITVHARLESLPSPPSPATGGPRQASGVEQLDAMLGGGFGATSTTLVLGAPGSGKTLLGLNFLAAGARAGDPALYFGFVESLEELIESARGTGLDLAPHVASGLFQAHVVRSSEANVDALLEQLIDTCRRRRIRRLFVDGLGEFASLAIEPTRVVSMISALIAQLRALGVTTMISEDAGELLAARIAPPTPRVAARVQNIILLRYVELRSQLYRLISVIKHRGDGYDRAIREFSIGHQGITVADTFATAEAVLSGLAHVLPNDGGAATAAAGSRKKRGKPSAKPRRGKRT